MFWNYQMEERAPQSGPVEPVVSKLASSVSSSGGEEAAQY